MTSHPTLIFIVGPTGAGKTEAGLHLGSYMPSAYLSADSMQVYKGMDIITDKLPKKIRKKYPYYLLDVVEPSRDFNVAMYVRLARQALKKIVKTGRTPVVVGGSGLYVDSLLYGIFEGPGRDEKLRQDLMQEAQEEGGQKLYQKLQTLDPEAAGKIKNNDLRRIVRALEVCQLARQPFSQLKKQRCGLKDDYNVFVFGLRRQRDDLYARINQRVDFMVNAGLLDEVRSLLKKRLSPTALGCLGIKEMAGFLRGDHDFKEAVRLLKRNSRRFAKRQMTWFRKNPDIRWIDIKPAQDLRAVAREIYTRSIAG